MDKDFRHPGGTEPMEIYNRTSRQDVRDILTNSYHMRGNKNITNLPDTKIKFSSNGFHSQIKKVFSKQNIATPTFVYILDTVKILFWVCWALILHPFLIRNNLDTRLSSFILGILRTYIAITILHPISHYSHCLNSTLRSYYYILLSTITGVSCYWWRLEHIENHHIFSVGRISKDEPDESGYPMYRTHKAQIRRWHHRYQWIYAVIMYCLSAAILLPSQFVFVFNQKELSMNRKAKEILPLIVSFMINHLYFDFTSNVMHLVPVGLYFTLSQLVNHRMPTVVDYVYKTKQNQRLTGEAIDWAEYQISSAVDFSVDSWFWNEVTGGLNHQATHHLFPMIHYIHYPKLRKVLMEYFPKEKTTRYKHWWEALQVHMKLLYDFSE